MKITIQLDRALGDHDPPFTSTDYVSGAIHLNLQKEDAVTRITLEFSGMLPFSWLSLIGSRHVPNCLFIGDLSSSVVATATNPLGSTELTTNNHKVRSFFSTIHQR